MRERSHSTAERRSAALLAVALALATAGCGGHGSPDRAGYPAPIETGAPAPSSPARGYSADDGLARPGAERLSGEGYDAIEENPFLETARAPLSTFSIDVDTASYTNTRRFLEDGTLPPREAVRVEEFVNYFSYDYPQPAGDAPFSVTTEVADCPWDAEHRLLRVGLKGREMAQETLPPSNLVFLIDTSGSMEDQRKLPLLKESMGVLVQQLTPQDRVAIVTYAGSSGLVLPPTPGDRKDEILGALSRLSAGGSTNGGAGIQLAYDVAERSLIAGGNNRVILATDGDFNVGLTTHEELVRLIEQERQKGVFLTVLGFGTGNLQDAAMEKLADTGNGSYAYVDTLEEGRRIFGRGLTGTLFTIAKDVKIQIEFNPGRVAGYRLIGYENRMLAARDFNDDAKDAGEIGAGHTVTALYEIVPAGREVRNPDGVDPLKYQQPAAPTGASRSGETATVKLRYKEPDGDQSRLMSVPVVDAGLRLGDASPDFRFSSAVAAFGMLLRGSKYSGTAGYDDVLALARESVGADLDGDRAEFLRLVDRARAIAR